MPIYFSKLFEYAANERDQGKTREKVFSNRKQIISHHDNIIRLPGQPGDVLSPDPSSAEGVIIMSTYEEMQIILTIALLVVAVLNMKNKK